MITTINEFLRNKTNKVFLGGTCAKTTWRDDLIKLLDINYFNPVVEEWTEEAQELEKQEKTLFCNIHFYCITKEMTGVFSIAEVVDSVHTPNITTILQVMPDGFDEFQIKSLNAVIDLIQSRGGVAYSDNDINKAAELLNQLA